VWSLPRSIRAGEQCGNRNSGSIGMDASRRVARRNERQFSRPCCCYQGKKCDGKVCEVHNLMPDHAQAFFPLLAHSATRNLIPRVVNISSVAGIIGVPNMSACAFTSQSPPPPPPPPPRPLHCPFSAITYDYKSVTALANGRSKAGATASGASFAAGASKSAHRSHFLRKRCHSRALDRQHRSLFACTTIAPSIQRETVPV
jgi:hypothetical protein